MRPSSWATRGIREQSGEAPVAAFGVQDRKPSLARGIEAPGRDLRQGAALGFLAGTRGRRRGADRPRARSRVGGGPDGCARACPARVARSIAARRGPMPGTCSRRPSCAASSSASSVSTSRCSWIRRASSGPSPGIDWNSCSGATAPRRRSSCAQRPVRTICAIAWASTGPMPGSASRPSIPSRSRSAATSSSNPATVSAARR